MFKIELLDSEDSWKPALYRYRELEFKKYIQKMFIKKDFKKCISEKPFKYFTYSTYISESKSGLNL